MSNYTLKFTFSAEKEMNDLIKAPYKSGGESGYKMFKIYGRDLKHPSLNTHKYDDIHGPNGEDVFESYAQNNTPGAYRVFWFYGPGKKELTVLSISPHP